MQITKPISSSSIPFSPSISVFSMFNLKSNHCCLLSLSFLTITAPTLPPTTVVPSTTPSDECDDDQASCHSGTGDDYDVTGANITLMRLQAILPVVALPSAMAHTGSTPLSQLHCSLFTDRCIDAYTCTHACTHLACTQL